MCLSIAVDRVGLNVREILQKTIQQVNCLPDATRNEMREQSNVGVGDMVVADSPIASIADMAFGEQVLLIDIPLRAIHRGTFACSPAFWKSELVVGINHHTDGFI